MERFRLKLKRQLDSLKPGDYVVRENELSEIYRIIFNDGPHLVATYLNDKGKLSNKKFEKDDLLQGDWFAIVQK